MTDSRACAKLYNVYRLLRGGDHPTRNHFVTPLFEVNALPETVFSRKLHPEFRNRLTSALSTSYGCKIHVKQFLKDIPETFS